jgi:putative spermidine/putrescine transport system permease protein
MQQRTGAIFASPMLAMMVLFFLAPLGVLAVASVTGPDGALTLDNYRTFLGDAFAVGVLQDTILLGLKTVAAVTLLGVPVALLYWHSGPRMRMLILLATLLPMLTSNVVRTFAWIVILGRNGPISQSFVELGLSSRPFSLLFSETGLVMALTQIELPLLVLPLIAVLSGADRRLVDASEVLGAHRWRSFVSVLLPMMTPAIFAGWVLVFASATTSYVTHSVIGGARLIYMPQFVYREVGILFQWPMAAAISFLLLVSTGIVMLAVTLLARHRRLAAYA